MYLEPGAEAGGVPVDHAQYGEGGAEHDVPEAVEDAARCCALLILHKPAITSRPMNCVVASQFIVSRSVVPPPPILFFQIVCDVVKIVGTKVTNRGTRLLLVVCEAPRWSNLLTEGCP